MVASLVSTLFLGDEINIVESVLCVTEQNSSDGRSNLKMASALYCVCALINRSGHLTVSIGPRARSPTWFVVCWTVSKII